MSSYAGPSARPGQRFAEGFGRFAVVVSVVALLAAAGWAFRDSWPQLGSGAGGGSGSTYAAMTPADPVRVAAAGTGVEVVAPLVASDTDPRAALSDPPEDAPLVSWWSDSAQAGAERGQTVLMAHATAELGGLTQLAELAKGDVVDLLTDEGTMRYSISSVRTFDPETMDRVGLTLFKQDGGAGRLVMVSAEGWDGVEYRRSVVATGTPLGQPQG